MSHWKEATFLSFDGEQLFYRYTAPKKPTKKTLVFLHRGHEHSERIVPIAEKISDETFWCFGYDMRGHGRSGGVTAWAENFDAWVKDLNSFIEMLRTEFDIQPEDIVVVSNSVGSAILVNWILSYSPGIKGAVLAAPAFSIKLYIPFAFQFLKLASFFSSKLFVTSYVKSRLLTNNTEEAKKYDADPYITSKIGVNILVTLLSSMNRVFSRLKDFETPVLLISAGQDYIVRNKWHSRFIEKISSHNKKHLTLPEYRHAVFNENNLQQVIDPCRAFIDDVFASRTNLPAIIHPRQHTVEEFRALERKGHWLTQLYFLVFRKALERIGRLSDGVAVGLAHGFDSGVSLDYVYRNTPSGATILGRGIDYLYLNSVGWRNVRKRKTNLKRSLERVTATLLEKSAKPVVLDVASGAARYLFEVNRSVNNAMELYVNDIDDVSLSAAKKLANQYNSHAEFFQLDIFEPSWTQKIPVAPNIVIVSGVFELYPNNVALTQALNAIYNLMDVGGVLIYSGQPWHPQLELISRLLNNRAGNRWIMRRRVQPELDELVTAAGFEKLNTLADDLGIFTISCAIKNQTP